MKDNQDQITCTTMDESKTNPLQSFFMDRRLLLDAEEERERPPSSKIFALITTKRHPQLPLAIHNYSSRSACLRQEWDELSLAARSLVTETTTGKVVSRSMPKFFNFHEKFAYKPTGREYAFIVEEKVDGSLISLFWYNRQWIFISRSSFSSIHADSARRILGDKYPGVLNELDKEMTYVFELIDPKLPIKVVYTQEALVLLSIISKDGKEPPYDFDWTKLPFKRPRHHPTNIVNPRELSKLDIRNEEGFVVKFWATAKDRYPKRIKVKLESYLDTTGDLGIQLESSLPSKWKAPPLNFIPPSNAHILDVYTSRRLKIQSFKESSISSIMAKEKAAYLRGLEAVADDYGGISWIETIGRIWDRIDAIFSIQEDELRLTLENLQREGYKPDAGNFKTAKKSRFEQRIRRNDIDKSLRDLLIAWYAKESMSQHVGVFLKNIEIPKDLREATEVIKCI